MKIFDHQNGQRLRIGSAEIYYEIAGTAGTPTLLVLHGGLGTIEDLNPILPALADNFSLIGIDSRGQGGSTLGTEGLSYERLQLDAEAVLAHLGIKELSIIGFSDGGTVGYRLAAFSGLKIEKLIILGATWHNKNTGATREILSKVTGQSWTDKFPETVELYNKLNAEPEFGRLVEDIKPMWLDQSESGHPNESVKNITAPTLIIRGDEDHLTALTDVAEVAKLIEKASIFIVPFGQHDVYNQQPGLITEAISQFIKR